MNRIFAVFIVLNLFFSTTRSQDFDLVRSLNFNLDVVQIKEGLNYGLVFNGPVFRFTYKNSWELNSKDLVYEGSFGFGPLSTRDMLGLNFHFKPIDLIYYNYKRIRKISIFAGPWLKMDYNYQLYPHLQSGYSFHFTNYSLGFGIKAKYRSDKAYLRLSWKNSLFGFISRPPVYRNPYFFDLSIGTYIKDQHRTFEFGSFDLYNNSSVEILYVNPIHPRLGYAYGFEYFSYRQEPILKAITHSFSLFFYPKT